MASTAILLIPTNLPSDKESMAMLGWEQKLSKLINYRGGYRLLKGLKPATKIGYIQNRGNKYEFSFGEFGDEAENLYHLAAAYPGNYFLVWTFGNAVHHLWLDTTGDTVHAQEWSLRLRPAAGQARDLEALHKFLAWFDGSEVKTDSKRLEEQYQTDEISVKLWFQALGFTGASELIIIAAESVWQDFEQVALSLLRGDMIEVSLTKRLNAYVQDERDKLKTKPLKRVGATARALANAHFDIAEAVGHAATEAWHARRHAAELYWDIVDCPACASLTYGVDKNGLGEAAALGRLLNHYPLQVRRDPLFYMLAGMEAESANGHAYVNALLGFAELAESAGFFLAIFPSRLRESFWQAFGIGVDGMPEPLHPDWSAELFVDLPSCKVQLASLLANWFGKQRAEGGILRGEANGTCHFTPFGDSLKIENEDHLPTACQQLAIPTLFAAFNLPDLLEPGAWQEGAFTGNAQATDSSDERLKVLQNFANLPDPIFIPSLKALPLHFGDGRKIRHAGDIHYSGSNEPWAFRLALRNPDSAYLRDLANDLRFYEYLLREVWLASDTIYGFAYISVSVSIFLRILADVPDGTQLTFYLGKKLSKKPGSNSHFEIKNGLDKNKQSLFSTLLPTDLIKPPSLKPQKNIKLRSLYPNGRIPNDASILNAVIYKKAQDRIFSVDLSGCSYGPREEVTKLCEFFTNELGFKALGCLLCESYNNVFIQGFASTTCYAVFMFGIIGSAVVELFTWLSDGGSLTTTTNDNSGGKKQANQNVQIFPINSPNLIGEPPYLDMLERHQEKLSQYEQQGISAMPIEATKEALAKSIACFL